MAGVRMDKLLKETLKKTQNTTIGAYLDGYMTAIALLKTNKFMGHYAGQCATWLEKHLNEEVSSNTTSTKKGFK